MKWRNILTGVAVLAALAGCNRRPESPNTPEGTLQKYVSSAFEVRSIDDKQKLLDLSTGDARKYLEELPNETFTRQFVNSKLKFVNMKTKDLREEKDGDVSLVYELTYQDGSPDAIHTNKKIAYLSRDEKGTWKIKATKNVKTFLERKEDLTITPDMTGAAPKEEAGAKK